MVLLRYHEGTTKENECTTKQSPHDHVANWTHGSTFGNGVVLSRICQDSNRTTADTQNFKPEMDLGTQTGKNQDELNWITKDETWSSSEYLD